MNQQPLLISNHNKTTELHVEQMAIYLQSKIIEATDDQHNIYYLFFYKEQFLTYVKPTKLKRRTHIEKAFTKGIVLPSTHPLIHSLLFQDHPYKKRTFNQLVKKVQSLYSPQEVAQIATFFESFISKKTIFSLIQSIFYDYRRNGQMFSSYRILRILMDFAPNHSWVKGLSSDLNFIKYGKLYDRLSDELMTKDPIYMEKALYTDKSYNQLIQLLKNQSRWMDEIALYIHHISPENYVSLKQLLNNHFTDKEIIDVLEHLSNNTSDVLEINDDLLEIYLHHQNAEKMINLLFTHKLNLNPKQTQEFEQLLENVDLEPEQFPKEKVLSFLVPLFNINPEKAATLLHKFIVLQLKEYDIDSVVKRLIPLKIIMHAHPILEKLQHIQKLANDPDQQLLLGELYYEFQQFDQAIDCFSWEMELKSIDPKPVKWLSKIYNEIGMEQEHRAYRQLYIDMQKRA
ncbi:hypothetical protein MXL46_18800 [Heyndrickxia sporothermodurans]|uniref:Uncharacterized protein n=1 Tax=Heyndrickxia sporothermodurans TaxID=46224 RepID=A0AB37HB58_9BACI|nr:hypothetical protein [Heyndrickxia sporothermodurans]MBL5771576.1 hypothetical protein [Heyndrickxia sporothermodurans]MBL5774798.1 hypothetical protein [Heyndrickxia sporothermodurans]MBL5792744.1 hypothetical protein [Heyndrickxia sporothermodurans]MBL5796104.1 hypothetical protein [Heyndrickxia sporothermodurans]MBL5807011.1 hypothetical protein [Heyndrickxia sporothermodurans]